MEIGEKYLPIGTVVMLKNGKKPVMIKGLAVSTKADVNLVYDYSAVLYPVGEVGGTQLAVFNHDQIEKVLFMGYVTEEQKQLNEKLLKLVGEKRANAK